MSVAEIRTIRAEIDACEKRLSQAIHETYPIGQQVTYRLRRGSICCEVMAHGYGGTITLRNVETDKLRWVQGDVEYLSPFVSKEKGGRK